ncbi:hypothetical protein KPL70_008858 [Citrus sinensis]|nr:hypothetical protein KPL70_008858 [Citrus sinensis]
MQHLNNWEIIADVQTSQVNPPDVPSFSSRRKTRRIPSICVDIPRSTITCGRCEECGHNRKTCYLNDPEATAATIDVEGLLHTGDIGYVDHDDEVPPAEIEALLLSHPSIADATVVPQKDEVAGEVPVAFVVRSNGFELTEEAIKEYIAKQVVFYKRLHKVHFVHAIPKSPSGKILRKDLIAKLASSMPLN